jgi:Arc/MetJ-type ribon-helix-helix transcriptional regulator
MTKKATSVRLSHELVGRVRKMIADTREVASVTEAIEIALEDWLENGEAELEARGLPNPNGPVSEMPAALHIGALGPGGARARGLAGWRDRYPTQTAMILFQPGADWRSIDLAATELHDMLATLPE